MTQKVISKDGTKIVYTKTGSGPMLIQVLGALNKRGRGEKLADLLKKQYTVISYDRRGRGDSEDSSSYTVDKEVNDLEAIIDDIGEKAYLCGHSSGGILVLHAAKKLCQKISGIAVYEVPYNDNPDALKIAKNYKSSLLHFLNHSQYDEAVALFVKSVGVSDKQIAAMKKLPMWKGLTAMAPTLRYDTIELMESYPRIHIKQISVPALVMYGEASPLFMAETAKTLSTQLPKANLTSLKGQTHDVKAAVLAPILIQYLK
jgi:pimeloyl-ACP methyl ester carboxylesterase